MGLITVACVLKSGGIYTHEWVKKLQASVAEYSPDCRFVCLTDMPVPQCENIPLAQDWPSWWSKINLFQPSVLTGPTIYLDLDTIVTGDISVLADVHGFHMVQDFNHPDLFNSSAMFWKRPPVGIYYDMIKNSGSIITKYSENMGGKIGDQAYISDSMGKMGQEIRTFPKELVVSYKRDAIKGPPKGAVAVTFHGKPKMHEAGGWAEKA